VPSCRYIEVVPSLRHALRRLSSAKAVLEADELASESSEAGVDRICTCLTGEVVTLRGTVGSVTVNPASVVPQFESELYDGTGRMRIVWLGRRSVPGVEAGRKLVVTGRVTCDHVGSEITMFNPAYELAPLGT
jgi:hypothetical protein